MSTQTEIENLIYHLNLSQHQACEIYRNRNSYNLSRLQMRGGVLFVPRNYGFISRILKGQYGDIIGRNRTFLRGAQKIRLATGGYHRAQLGRSTYYGTPDGLAITKDQFLNYISQYRK